MMKKILKVSYNFSSTLIQFLQFCKLVILYG